ncbi:MAG: DNA polymerase I [Ruminococcaceae bacterium]|nr:DNA polymerase I [Oscillospiraceae bacterium]
MRLLVIDGNSIVNRAFYGIKLLTTKDGQFTNGIYGFMNILIKLREECQPDRAAVAFDLKAPTFRHKMYDGYKAGRKGMPEELRSQMPVLKELLTALGYTVVEKEGYEADDILGTLSARCKGEDLCFIATGDRDSLQLVSDNTRVLLASTKMGKAVTTVYDKEKLMEEYGVEPKGMIEIKALMGDSSDNIPGVAGVGQKTAGDLIRSYGSIDYIYEHIDELDIKKGVHDKLLAGRDMAYLSRTLGTICLEAPIDLDMDRYVIGEGDLQKALSLLVSLEMFGIIEKLGLTKEKIQVIPENEREKKHFTEQRDLPFLLGRIKDEAYFLTDFGADGEIERLYFSFDDGAEYVAKDCFDFGDFIGEFLSSESKKHTADIKSLYKYALRKGIEIKNAVMDTALAGYILNPSASSYAPDRLCEEYSCLCDAQCDEAEREKAVVAVSFKTLCGKLASLIEENGQTELLCDIELPLSLVLADMENTGFLVDREGIEDFGKKLSLKVQELTEKIYAEAGFEFNINSPKQLGAALFEKLGLPCKKKTKSGYSTNADVLEELAGEYPIVADVLEYRTLAKLKSTYCEGLLKVIDSDGRIRSTLNQTETRTGRISSTEPNLQNIPVRSELGKEMRRFFTSDEGRCLVDADYSQIELRVLAHLSGDAAMTEGFNNGEDIHAITASQVFNIPLFMVTPLMRSRAKAVNFGIVYGIGAFSLAKDIGVTRKEADNYIKGYLHHYSAVRDYLERVVEKARDDGYVSTVFHRRRYLPELSASNKMLQAFGERVAKNMPVQGTAADIIKIAMVRVYHRLIKEKLDAKLIMQVHDELIVECAEKDRQAAEIVLKQEMENACKMKVKLLADVHSGKTWYDAKG